MDIPFYCPECKNNLDTKNGSHFCGECSLEYPVVNGIPSFVKDDSFKNNHFLSEYFDDLIATEKRHFWHKTKRKLLYKYLQSNIPNLDTIGFFELGCGSGYFLNYLMERGVKIQGGGDLFVESLQIASDFINIPLYRVNALQLPFKDEFGIVALLDIIEHIEDDTKVLKEVHGSLKQGGYVLVTVPALEMLRRNLDNVLRHKRRYTKKQLRDRLTEAGYSNIRITYFNGYIIPFLLVQRFLERIGVIKIETDEKKVIENSNAVSPLWNSLFQLASAVERPFTVRFGIPAGASLVAIGQKQ